MIEQFYVTHKYEPDRVQSMGKIENNVNEDIPHNPQTLDHPHKMQFNVIPKTLVFLNEIDLYLLPTRTFKK